MIINFRGMQNFNPHYPSFAYAICRVFVYRCILCERIAGFEILNVVVIVCLSVCRFMYIFCIDFFWIVILCTTHDRYCIRSLIIKVCPTVKIFSRGMLSVVWRCS